MGLENCWNLSLFHLRRCPNYCSSSAENQELIIAQTTLLGNSQHLRGLIPDALILGLSGGFRKTPITNMGERVLIQQRALWLMSDEVLNFRTAREAEKLQITLEREERARLRDEALTQRALNEEPLPLLTVILASHWLANTAAIWRAQTIVYVRFQVIIVSLESLESCHVVSSVPSYLTRYCNAFRLPAFRVSH